MFSAAGLLFVSLFSTITVAEETSSYDSGSRRDPFIPLVMPDGRLIQLQAQGTRPDLAIEGIMYDENGISYAIVNGEVVNVGDTIAGWQVLKVLKDRVVFIKDANRREIELTKEEGEQK